MLVDVRTEGAVLRRSRLEPPWAITLDDGAAITIVVLLQGSGIVELAGPDSRIDRPSRRQELDEGDIAIVTGPAPIRVSDRSRATADHGPTGLLTGSYRVPSDVSQRLLGVLPEVLVLRTAGELCPVMGLLLAEAEGEQPGQQAVLERLLDLLLLSSLRGWLGRQEKDLPGWYAALSDPVLGAVLPAIHAAPAAPWTVATLAQQAGVSRATVARRFVDVVGETPMAYLTRLRLATASDLLRTSDLTLDAVARQVGYQNGFGLSAAFKRVLGHRPRDARASSVSG